ncbi:MAG: RDD family protein, partial [Clostridiales bacterium]|nr:RDD family protein [Clostridiales bacterium]
MDDYQIKTPEQVDIGYAIAGLGTRCMALAIDMFIQAVALTGIIILLISNGLWLEAFGGWYMALLIIVIALIVGGYYIFFEWLMKGKTPGKALLRVRVMRLD